MLVHSCFWPLGGSVAGSCTSLSWGSCLPLMCTLLPQSLSAQGLGLELLLLGTCLRLSSRVFGHKIQGKDCGDETAHWINTFLTGNEPYRLVQFEHHMKLRNSKEEFALYRRNDKTAYSDIAPIMLLSEASVEDLNTKLDKKVKMQNFRPCIVVSGCCAYQEDSWDDIIIGSAGLKSDGLPQMHSHHCGPRHWDHYPQGTTGNTQKLPSV